MTKKEEGSAKARWRTVMIIGAILPLAVLAVLRSDPVVAFESYHDPTTPDAGYCAQCHPGFVNRGDLHDLHVGNNEFTNTCALCHTSSDRDNPLTMWSQDNNRGCAGCHGRDYGETTAVNWRGFPSAGQPKNSGRGLRLLHSAQGCDFCHGPPTAPPIDGEDVDPTYYALADVNILNACNTDGSEDGTPEPNGEDTLGLDNDGDGLIDGADPDCLSGTVGETSGPLAQMIVGPFDGSTGTLSISYASACLATANTIEYGDLNDTGAYWVGQQCGVGTSGSYDWVLPGGAPNDLFFVIVGNEGLNEGSYGLARGVVTPGVETERPEDTTSTDCPVPQDLSAPCG